MWGGPEDAQVDGGVYPRGSVGTAPGRGDRAAASRRRVSAEQNSSSGGPSQ